MLTSDEVNAKAKASLGQSVYMQIGSDAEMHSHTHTKTLLFYVININM